MFAKIKAWFEAQVLDELHIALRPELDPDYVPDEYWEDKNL